MAKPMTRVTPLARMLAEANGTGWAALTGTGDAGTVTEEDILKHVPRLKERADGSGPAPDPHQRLS